MNGWRSIVLLIMLAPVLISVGCIDETVKEGDLRYLDPLGEEVVLEATPERIVTLSPALTETVFALGLGDRVVATDNVSNYPAEAMDLPKVFSFNGVLMEQLIMTDPDLVIMDKTLDISENSYNLIRDIGIPVYRIYPRNVEDVLNSIIGIGNITGSEEKASELVADFRNRMDEIINISKEPGSDERPKVLLVTYYDGGSDPWVSTDSTMAGGLIEAAGGSNVISNDAGIVVEVPVETIIGADPDIIICTQSNVWRTESRTKILSDDRWKDIGAVKHARVYEIDGDLVDRTGPRMIEGLEGIYAHIMEFHEE